MDLPYYILGPTKVYIIIWDLERPQIVKRNKLHDKTFSTVVEARLAGKTGQNTPILLFNLFLSFPSQPNYSNFQHFSIQLLNFLQFAFNKF